VIAVPDQVPTSTRLRQKQSTADTRLMQKIIVIVGPTASGKSELAVDIV